MEQLSIEHYRMNGAAIFSNLKADAKVRELLDGFQIATRAQLSLSPVVPPSIGDLMSGAHGRRFCRCLPDTSDETRANCLRTHTELRTTASAKGVLESRTCLAGLTHATVPIIVGGNSVAVLEMTGLALETSNPTKLTDSFRRFLQRERAAGNDSKIGKILEALETLERYSEKEIAAIFALVEVLAHWISTHAAHYPEVLAQVVSAPLAHAMEYSKRRYADSSLTAADVAAEAGITCQRLAQLFRKSMGMTFSEWIVRYRLSMAMARLRSSEAALLDISDECGFGTASSFYRAFQKFMGITPNRYRLGDEPTSKVAAV